HGVPGLHIVEMRQIHDDGIEFHSCSLPRYVHVSSTGAFGVSYHADVVLDRASSMAACSPSHTMRTSIRTPDTRCLIFSCKIPVNSLRNLFLYGDPSAKRIQCSAQDMLLRSLRWLKKPRILPSEDSLEITEWVAISCGPFQFQSQYHTRDP